MSEKDYNLKKSQKVVGQLYPVLLSKDGKVIDGKHRLEQEKDWRVEEHSEIDTEYKYFCARLISNFNRRRMNADEIAIYVNKMAEILWQEGLRARPEKNSIAQKITDDVGWKSSTTVHVYLDDKYKAKDFDTSKLRAKRVISKTTPYTLADAENEFGDEKVSSLKEAIKKELSEDADFIIDTVEKAPMTLPLILEKRPYTREGYYKPFLTKKQAEELREAHRKTEEDLQKRREDPELQARARLTKAWMSIGHVLGVLDNLFCPKCGSDAKTHLVWKCHPEIGMVETQNLYKSKLEH